MRIRGAGPLPDGALPDHAVLRELTARSVDVPQVLKSSVAHSLAALESCSLLFRLMPSIPPSLRKRECNVLHNRALLLDKIDLADELKAVLLTSLCRAPEEEDRLYCVLALLELYLDDESYDLGYHMAHDYFYAFQRSGDEVMKIQFNAFFVCFAAHTDGCPPPFTEAEHRFLLTTTVSWAGLLVRTAVAAKGYTPMSTDYAGQLLRIASSSLLATDTPVRLLFYCFFNAIHLYMSTSHWVLNIVLDRLDTINNKVLERYKTFGRSQYHA